ncbi:ABC transporter permease [Sphingobacterium sp. N143]|uniref:ABC transporter permease n=1 Tax=Sphingobacterium sp. N143 TaxID=2746727 RepID=UPI002578A453|nr:ABC transporter permease [Sphingobacterium sp. N143]MDM1294839.1 ABC transporter permease [Sphingobacterium sp. N143]
MSTFKFALRSIIKNKRYTWINVLGLSIGLTLCLLVFAVVIEENSYDKSWKNKDHLFRIVTIDSTAGLERQIAGAFVNLSSELQHIFPEIQKETTIESNKLYLKVDARSTQSIRIPALEAETSVLDMLDINVLEGNPSQLIQGKTNLLIDKEFKEKYFKDENVIGKIIQSADPFANQTYDYVITGVMDKLPYNSTLRTSIIALLPKMPMKLSKDGSGYYRQQFLQLKSGISIVDLERKINRWYSGFLNPGVKNVTSFRLQPIHEIYMEPLQRSEISGNPKTTKIFVGVALLVLIISCINFINIYAVRTIKKLKSLHIHTVLGASRAQIIKRLLLETILIFFVSALISIILFKLCLPQLENFLGYALTYIRSIQLPLLASFLMLSILLGPIIGFYPAWLVSRIKSTDGLKNKLSQVPNREVFIKKILITVQFSISIVVIIGLITIKSQLNYMQSSSLGIKVNNVLNVAYFNMGAGSIPIKEELNRITGIEAVSIAAWTPSVGSGYMAKNIADKDNPEKNIQVSFIAGDAELPKILNMQLIKGRLLAPEDYKTFETSTGKEEEVNNALITESTAKKLGIHKLNILYKDLQIVPVGIIKDFHSESFHKKMVPTVILAKEFTSYGNILIKVREGQEQQVLQAASNIIQKAYPNKLIALEWADDLIAKQYEKESKQVQLFVMFSILTLLTSALGITGLIMQSLEQRTKEIGIRKVLGATMGDISHLFSKDYLILITIAVLIASPIAWYFAQKWLEEYAYNIGMQWWFFILAALVIFLTSMITVNIQTIRAALINPVNSLREE